MKRFGIILALFGLLAACLFLLPKEVYAATEYTEAPYTYVVSDGEATIIEVDTTVSGDITIPSTLGDYPVTGIKSFAFNNCTKVTNITIPAGIIDIGDHAFYECKNLAGIWVDKANPAYSSDSWGVLFDKNKKNLIDAPDAIRGNYTVPNGVVSIGESNFSTYEDYSDAFYGCSKLTGVTIPNSVKNIYGFAFTDCANLKYINISSIATWFDIYLDMSRFSFDGAALYINGNVVTNLEIPHGVAEIPSQIFCGCSSLISVTIPDSVTAIGWNAFEICENLAHIYYTGTKEQWDSINFMGRWDTFSNATIHFKDSTDPDDAPAGECTDHTWDLGVITTEATCKEAGIKTYTCTKCGNAKTEIIAKLASHSYKSEWSKDGTNHWHECSVCQNKKDLVAHTLGAATTETTAQTCMTCGYVIHEAIEGTQGGKVLKKVFAYSSTQEDGFWLQLLDVDGTAYILDIDATLVAPYDEVQFIPNGATYICGKHTVKYTGNIETYNGGEYYNLQELMNLLNVRYDYVAESQTIMFKAATSFEENLIEDCDDIYADYYGLDYLDNPAYYGLGAAYNIISGFRIDFLWGNYQTEMREEVVVNIMAADQNAESFVDLLNKGDSFAKKAITVYKGLNDATSGIERYSNLLNCPEAEWLKAYDKVSKGGGVFGFSDFLDIAQLAYDAQGAYSTYATAVKYGLVKNNNMKHVGDDCLKTAANNVYSYYEQETHVFSDMLADTVKTAGNNITTKAIKDIIKNGTGYKGNITKLVKLFADEVLQMKEMTTAVEHTHICATIQKAAMLQYKASNDPLTKKYCTILYLRACQYAYSLYSFDPILKQLADDWNNETQDAIEDLVAYSDTELSRTVKNGKLDMTHEGFVVVSVGQN